MSTMHVLDTSGDRVIEFDRTDEASLAAAEQAMQEHLARGGAMIRTKPGDPEVIREFDPGAEELVAIPQIQGG